MRQAWLGQSFMFLMAVLTPAEHRQEHDRGGLSSSWADQDQTDDRFLGQQAGIPGIPIALCPLLRPAHRILADDIAEDRGERSAHAMARQ
jgi:hypothetical protein